MVMSVIFKPIEAPLFEGIAAAQAVEEDGRQQQQARR